MSYLKLAAMVGFVGWVAGFGMGRGYPWPEELAAQRATTAALEQKLAAQVDEINTLKIRDMGGDYLVEMCHHRIRELEGR